MNAIIKHAALVAPVGPVVINSVPLPSSPPNVIATHNENTSSSNVLDVLVVEDDSVTRDLLVGAVRSLGHSLRVATNGDEAYALLRERRADVVISDWQMPEMNGAELCQRIRQLETTVNDGHYTYFILLSAFHDRSHLLDGMVAGADDFQRKPLDLDELEARFVSASRVVALHRHLAERERLLRRDSSNFWVASRTDALTGLGNRRHMEEELAGAWARAERYGHAFSVAIVDVDHFKNFNDSFGHLAGDEALRRIAKALREGVRTSDAVFRYGGEELLVLLPEQSLSEAYYAMDRLRLEVALKCRDAHGIANANADAIANANLTVSAGVAELDRCVDASVADWLARADAALYSAKESGRNRVERALPTSNRSDRSDRSDVVIAHHANNDTAG